jgi:hypothetical protein
MDQPMNFVPAVRPIGMVWVYGGLSRRQEEKQNSE